jgi:hypothetical protein
VRPKPNLTALLPALALLGGLAAPAQAKIIEIGQTTDVATPSCPRTCNAISRTTGYQAKIGPKRGVFIVPQDGRIVAWTIQLSKPGPSQIKFFNENLGGEASAGISVLRPGKKLFARTIATSSIYKLTPFFGTTVQFALNTSIPVQKGYVVALTTPTWVPALAVNLPTDTSWRASRAKGTCDETSKQTAQTGANSLAQYYCLYRGARLTYSATFLPDPVPPK